MATHREHFVGAAAAALLLAAFASVAAPHPGRGPEGHGPDGFGPAGHMLERAGRALQLTDQQQEQARQLLEARRPQMDALHQQMRDAHEKLAAALDAKDADAASVGRLAIAQHRLHLKGKALHEEMAKAFQALLTPEQQQKFELLKSMHEDGPHHGRFGHGPRPADGPEGEPR